MPIGHPVHVAVAVVWLTNGEYEPFWQWIVYADEFADGQYVPPGHGVGSALPVPGQYVPAGHPLHADGEVWFVSGL